MMNLWYLALMVVTVLPILIGIGAFGAIYVRDEFYKFEFYEDEEA